MDRIKNESVLNLLRYSFSAINYDYSQLTDTEKSLITESAFNDLAKQLKDPEDIDDKRLTKLVVIVDYIKDFVDGVLGSINAKSIEDNIVKLLEESSNYDTTKYKRVVIVFLDDCHSTNYLSTREGKHLPIEHSIIGTEGAEIYGKVRDWCYKNIGRADLFFVNKSTFGNIDTTGIIDEMISDAMDVVETAMNSDELNNENLSEKMEPDVDEKTWSWNLLYETYQNLGNKTFIPDEIQIAGIAIHVCVISNVAILMSEYPQAEIYIKEDTVADYNPELGIQALNIMRDWGVNIIN